MLHRAGTLTLTDMGREFLRNYEKIKELIERMGLDDSSYDPKGDEN